MKTAVEWLADEIIMLEERLRQEEINLNDFMDLKDDLVTRALEMEKEIAEKEFFKGLNFGINIPNDMTPSQYYNKTFKQQEQ
jgi:hypothetical protein